MIRKDISILHSNIQCLTSVDTPAIDRCLEIKEQLQLKCIACVYYQAIHCKAIDLKWRYPDRHNDCVRGVPEETLNIF